MQRVLSLLVAYVFLQTQSWGLSGGPVYTSGALNSAIIGTYAGVMVPSVINRIFDNPATITTPQSDANALGIFILGVPDVGIATGSYLFFQEGEAFFGAIQGVLDPQNGELRALTSGAAATNNLQTGVEFLSPITAVGKIEAKVEAGSGIGQSLRLSGEAFFQLQGYVPDTSPNGFGFATLREITFEVDGFKQSDNVSAGTIAPPNTQGVQPPVGTTPTVP